MPFQVQQVQVPDDRERRRAGRQIERRLLGPAREPERSRKDQPAQEQDRCRASEKPIQQSHRFFWQGGKERGRVEEKGVGTLALPASAAPCLPIATNVLRSPWIKYDNPTLSKHFWRMWSKQFLIGKGGWFQMTGDGCVWVRKWPILGAVDSNQGRAAAPRLGAPEAVLCYSLRL